MHLFLSVGEPSGDQHAAHLMHELRRREPGIRLSGFGGPEMETAGLESLHRLTDMAVMGLAGVFPLLKQFYSLYGRAAAFFERERPDAVLLVDFPGFNWWIAKAAKRAGVPVYYYCPPQLWAWAPWRIRKVRRRVDAILSVLPFEAEWYRERGVEVEYVGHPFFDEVTAHSLDEDLYHQLRTASGLSVGILPGSRKQEVNRNFPAMLDVIETLHRRHPHVRFPVACYKPWHRDRCAAMLRKRSGALPVELHVGKTPEIIEAADCCLMVSGSVSLEMLARRTPAVVMYRATLSMYWLGGAMITCGFMSLPNLIADRAVMPEFPFQRRRSPSVGEIASLLDHWLSDPRALQSARGEMSALADEVVRTGGVDRAAEAVARRLGVSPIEYRAAG